jgi:hypothetical protein
MAESLVLTLRCCGESLHVLRIVILLLHFAFALCFCTLLLHFAFALCFCTLLLHFAFALCFCTVLLHFARLFFESCVDSVLL